MFPPERIVCLTEETVETLYLLGEEHRIVGTSGYVATQGHVTSGGQPYLVLAIRARSSAIAPPKAA
jgi:hypothetical protein